MFMLPWVIMQIQIIVRAAIGCYQRDRMINEIKGNCDSWYYLKMQKPDEIEKLIVDEIKYLKNKKKAQKMQEELKAVEGNRRKTREVKEKHKKEAADEQLEEEAKAAGTWKPTLA